MKFSEIRAEAERAKDDEKRGWCSHADMLLALVEIAEAAIKDREKTRAAMSRALDALESDSELEARRKAFERLQDQFEEGLPFDRALAKLEAL